ncbi:MAG TPA: metallophosphoesterase [Acidimicrobiales bacterium]|nr:metallophosphoesterase [Acidimicrobiales bacterium]
MADISWVCLSDTHFGAENSLLSHIPGGRAEVDPMRAGPVLETLCQCLRDLVATNENGRRPTLVLNGDALEFALASDEVAAMAFERFVELVFGDGDPLFDDTIVYIPGNHDHHVWETARERQYARYVSKVPRTAPLGEPWHSTYMFETERPEPLEAELLTALVRRRGGPKLRVRVVYPNLAVANESGSRSVLFHHGHLVEPAYLLMSRIKGALFPGQRRGEQVWDWEADNFAWIDFFWSTLGRSGSVGKDIGLVYDMLQDERAVGELAGNLGRLTASRVPRPVRPILTPLFRGLARWGWQRAGDRERSRGEAVLSSTAERGLMQFVTGPLRLQLQGEEPELATLPTTFVFGHTHKPFERLQEFAGFRSPVAVFNSGGWVVETEQSVPLHGASIILVDEDGEVAALRMFNQADSRADYAVRLADGLPGRSSRFHQHLADRLKLTTEPWPSFSAAVAKAVDQRHRLLPQIVERGIALTRKQAS